MLGRRGSQRLAVRSRCEEAMAEAVGGDREQNRNCSGLRELVVWKTERKISSKIQSRRFKMRVMKQN